MGIGYNMTNRSILKLNLASGYRAPNIAELSANGIHDGTLRYEYGSAKLTSENSLQADLGFSWSADHIMVNVAVFDNFIKNFIFIRKLNTATGADSIPIFNNEQSFSAFAYNQSDANLYGGEVYIDLHPHPFDWLHLENTFSYVRGQLIHPVEGNDNLPYMPPTRWLLGLRAQKRKLGKNLITAYAKLTFDNNSAQTNVFTPYGTETTTPGYTLLNAGIGTDVTNKKHQVLFSVSIAAQNLTDIAYQNALSRLRYTETNQATGRPGIYNMGRNFSLMLSIPFEINYTHQAANRTSWGLPINK
jgi:iron complex outermembrane receptor protein